MSSVRGGFVHGIHSYSGVKLLCSPHRNGQEGMKVQRRASSPDTTLGVHSATPARRGSGTPACPLPAARGGGGRDTPTLTRGPPRLPGSVTFSRGPLPTITSPSGTGTVLPSSSLTSRGITYRGEIPVQRSIMFTSAKVKGCLAARTDVCRCTMLAGRQTRRGPYREVRGKEIHWVKDGGDTDEKVTTSCPYAAAFLSYKEELDAKHDKYERLVKLSRDTTVLSKRLIFFLHRASGCQDRGPALKEAEAKMREVSELLQRTAKELRGEDPYLQRSAYSPGLQEFIEALSYYTFLRDTELVSLQEVQQWLSFSGGTMEEVVEEEEEGEGGKGKVMGCEKMEEEVEVRERGGGEVVFVPLSELNYVLGVADLTGELMRMCITAVGVGQEEVPFQLLPFIRALYCGFHSLVPVSGEVLHKLKTLRSSLAKIEMACYQLRIRGSEIPRHMLGEVFQVPADADTGYHYDSD